MVQMLLFSLLLLGGREGEQEQVFWSPCVHRPVTPSDATMQGSYLAMRVPSSSKSTRIIESDTRVHAAERSKFPDENDGVKARVP